MTTITESSPVRLQKHTPGSRCVRRTPDAVPTGSAVWEFWATYSPEHARVCLAELLAAALPPDVAAAVDPGRLDTLAHAAATSPLRDDVRRLALLLRYDRDHRQGGPSRVRARLLPLVGLPRCGPDRFGDAVAGLWEDEEAGSERFDLVDPPTAGTDGLDDALPAGESA